jgi:hypothetical protein
MSMCERESRRSWEDLLSASSNLPSPFLSSSSICRAFVQAVFAYTGPILSQDTSNLPGPGPSSEGSMGPEYREPFLVEQVARLKSVKVRSVGCRV